MIPEHVSLMYFNREYLRESLGAGSGREDMVGAFLVQVDSPADVPRIAAAIDKEFEVSPFPTRSESEKAFELSFISFLGNLRLFIFAICGAVTFTILLVSGNTISMSVRERVREVGILKTLGFTPGAVLGHSRRGRRHRAGRRRGRMLARGRNVHCGPEQPGRRFHARAPHALHHARRGLGLPAGALLIGLISSFVPAWNASRTSILEALRSTA